MIMIWISLSFMEWQVWDGQVTGQVSAGISRHALLISRLCPCLSDGPLHIIIPFIIHLLQHVHHAFIGILLIIAFGSVETSSWFSAFWSGLLTHDIKFLVSKSYFYTHLFSLSLAFFAAFSPEVTYGQVFPVTLFFSISNTVSVLICSKNEFMLQIKLKIYMYELYSKVFSMTTHFHLTFKWLN